MALTEIIEENVGKTSYTMMSFFQKMIKEGELKAFSVEVNKKTVKKDDENKTIVRIKKGATLTETTKLWDNQPYFIEDPKTGIRYFLTTGTRGGMFYNDGDGQYIYHHCLLKKLDKSLDYKIVTNQGHDDLFIPSDKITAQLRIDLTQTGDYSGSYDRVENLGGCLKIEGEVDPLFEKIYEFVTGRKIIDPIPKQEKVPF